MELHRVLNLLFLASALSLCVCIGDDARVHGEDAMPGATGTISIYWPPRKAFVAQQVDVTPTDVGLRILLPEGTVPHGAFEANEPEAIYFWSRAGEALIKVSLENGRVLWKSVCPGIWGVSEGPGDKLFLHSVDRRPVWQFHKRSDTLQETVYSPGRGVRAMAFCEDGSIGYWADTRERAVYEVDMSQPKVTRAFQTEIGAPFSLALTPDGNKLYVGTDAVLLKNAQTASETRWTAVEVVDLLTGELIEPIVVRGLLVDAMAFSPSGDQLYVVTAFAGEGYLNVVDVATDTLLTGRDGVYLSAGLTGVMAAPDPRYCYVSGIFLFLTDPEESPRRLDGPFVALVDLESHEVVARVAVDGTSYLTVSADGKRLYVTGEVSDTIDIINTVTLFEMAGVVPPWESTTETQPEP